MNQFSTLNFFYANVGQSNPKYDSSTTVQDNCKDVLHIRVQSGAFLSLIKQVLVTNMQSISYFSSHFR